MALTPSVLGTLAFTLLAFWGVAIWALTRTLRQEEHKVELLSEQDRIDTYSPRALADLREWIEENPTDPLVDDARAAHNECVETLRSVDRYYYDWTDGEVERLERL
ncbi:hypothetical protein [Halovivax gelatinilyticus]|uniref:hypothetical protein n=1 Tax=Halovivax gelatinilyticus TaxID=2961597 RepID=UPI0020CA8E72|nr:hypothetical protein [Halovivax gelatinilyticus]